MRFAFQQPQFREYPRNNFPPLRELHSQKFVFLQNKLDRQEHAWDANILICCVYMWCLDEKLEMACTIHDNYSLILHRIIRTYLSLHDNQWRKQIPRIKWEYISDIEVGVVLQAH